MLEIMKPEAGGHQSRPEALPAHIFCNREGKGFNENSEYRQRHPLSDFHYAVALQLQ